MPLFSCFTGFGFLAFSGAPSECEKVYRSLLAAYRDPTTGQPTLDVSDGTYKEAVLYGWASAIAASRVFLQRAGEELRPETAYATLEAKEARYGIQPGPNDTVVMRQAALLARKRAARGPRYEAIREALSGILGDDFVDYRPISITEAEAWPETLGESQGLFRRPDAVAKSVRILTPVARGEMPLELDSYDPGVGLSTHSLSGAGNTRMGQSFRGDGNVLTHAKFYLSTFGAPAGNVTATIYAHTGTFGGGGTPTGAALATSDPVNVASLASADFYTFEFTGANQITLEDGTAYFVVVEFSGAGGTLDVWASAGAGTHEGNEATYGGAWVTTAGRDVAFYVLTLQVLPSTVYYENWNRSLVEHRLVPGDVLCVDPGNLGLVEKVTITAAEGDGEERTFTARFRKPHSAEIFATTGPTPLWSNTKRHVLIVVKAAAAVDPDAVARVDALMRRISRAPTTWAIVRPTTPGAGTVGPFAIGSTSGSPLGAVPLESITL